MKSYIKDPGDCHTTTVKAKRSKPGRWPAVVGWLCRIIWFMRLVLMCEFTVRMIVSLTLGQYADAAWEIAVVIALCPALGQTANAPDQRPAE